MAKERSYITFVCTANICRSPVAEALLQRALVAQGEALSAIPVISAGVTAFNGDRPSMNSVRVLEKLGIDISAHRSQCLTQEIVERSFAIFGMTANHCIAIETQYRNPPAHVYLMRHFMNNTFEKEVPDPFGMAVETYEACHHAMEEAIPSIVEFIKKEYPLHESKHRS
tara:strand:- start:40855 stop:41361 length:507 start_codon:yes stop_codon:yes gene_type:complete